MRCGKGRRCWLSSVRTTAPLTARTAIMAIAWRIPWCGRCHMRSSCCVGEAEMRLADLLADTPFQGYSYAYPHKTAYRPLEPALRLDELWAGERRDALFLYLH